MALAFGQIDVFLGGCPFFGDILWRLCPKFGDMGGESAFRRRLVEEDGKNPAHIRMCAGLLLSSL